MSLPWFPFNINEYLSDTMALTTEEHGAYLLLMLHYYATETPPPDNDRRLAAIVKLPPSQWQDLRPSLEPYFQIEQGLWKHKRIENEIRNGHVKHSARKAQTAAATEAAARKRTATASVTDTPRLPPRTKQSSRTRQGPPIGDVDQSVTDSVDPSVTDTQKQRQKPIISLSPEAFENISVKSGDNPFIPDDWQPRDDIKNRCLTEASSEIYETELRVFIAHCQSEGTISKDWNASFTKFWQRGVEYRAKQAEKAPKRAPPRIEVNTQIDATAWEYGAKAFARNKSMWPRSLGPEPGQAGCKCPIETLTKYGIDPETGNVKTAERTR